MMKRIVLLAALAIPFVVTSVARADDAAPKKAKKSKKKAEKKTTDDSRCRWRRCRCEAGRASLPMLRLLLRPRNSGAPLLAV